jgi:predicted MFS family arabinose efflux permease
MVLTANFVVLPVVLRDQVGLNASSHWLFYLPILFVSFVLMLPFVIFGEKRRAMKQVMVGAIIVLGLAEISLIFSATALLSVTISMLLFFAAFNLLEASLPSLVTKISAPDSKGTSIGVFSSSQFLGAFVGGAIGGAFWEMGGPRAVFLSCAVAILLWMAVSASMKNPRYLSSYLINVGALTSEHANTMVEELTRVRGVAEVVIVPEDGVAYLKVDRRDLDEKRLREFSSSPA